VAKSKFIPRYLKIAELVRKRILHGDYALKPMPSERQLAREIGANHMTVRRSIHVLEAEKLIERDANGRLRVSRKQHGTGRHLNFAFLTPTFYSANIESWRATIENAAATLPCIVRPVLYMHWEDPILIDVLNGFDGVFLVPVPEPLPPGVAEKLRKLEHPVVVMDDDFSGYGLPSIEFFPPACVQRVLDHLESLGHARIGCLNTQPSQSIIPKRIDQWRYWMSAHGLTGRLADFPVPAHGDVTTRAYEVMSGILAEFDPSAETAWLCMTTPAAIGVMRACHDRGILPGRDLAICSVHGEGVAGMLVPSLTALEPADPLPFLRHCLNWMISGGPWQGSLVMRPTDFKLVVRESTGSPSALVPQASASFRSHVPFLGPAASAG
jgi:DNA-binding LacI/PurR family transcriptional regulator/DNA-binding transcriptional regulator YhcF (GntR family)